MKRLFLAVLTFFALPLAHARESADDSNVTCTGTTTDTVTRENGQSNDLENIERITIKVKGNEQVATGTVALKTTYRGSQKQIFNIEVSLGFSDGHAEKNIKLGAQISGHSISTESAIIQEAAVSMKVDELDVNCRID